MGNNMKTTSGREAAKRLMGSPNGAGDNMDGMPTEGEKKAQADRKAYAAGGAAKLRKGVANKDGKPRPGAC